MGELVEICTKQNVNKMEATGNKEPLFVEPKYLVVEGSNYEHFAYNFMVVDTECGKIQDFWCVTICECFDKESAELVCDALNLAHELKKNKWEEGKSVRITHCIYGHEFEIGEVVQIVDYYGDGGRAEWYCTNGKTYWYISENEGELV